MTKPPRDVRLRQLIERGYDHGWMWFVIAAAVAIPTLCALFYIMPD